MHQNLPQATASMVKKHLKSRTKNFRLNNQASGSSRPVLVEPSSRDKRPSLNDIQGGSKNQRRPTAQPLDQRSAKWKEEQEEIARHRAHMFRKELFRTEEHDEDVRNTNVFRRYVLTQRLPFKEWRFIPETAASTKKGMYIVPRCI